MMRKHLLMEYVQRDVQRDAFLKSLIRCRLRIMVLNVAHRKLA